jgi:hypothetical protein
MDKLVASPAGAVADIGDGASIGIAGFGAAHRVPSSLIIALRDQGFSGLTICCNGLGQPGFQRRTCSRTAIRSGHGCLPARVSIRQSALDGLPLVGRQLTVAAVVLALASAWGPWV